ncbi:MAG: SPOR domain-containing protein [Bacteroidota bacterium]
MDRKGMQVIKDVASKTAGLVFFSLLAIALGVVFGVMFEKWVGGETGTPTSTTSLETPIEEVALPPGETTGESVGVTGEAAVPAPVTTTVKYRVRVGPYPDYAQAAKAAEALRAEGYPIYLANHAPYLIQVGAFANKDNAATLKTQLSQKGYSVAIQAE